MADTPDQEITFRANERDDHAEIGQGNTHGNDTEEQQEDEPQYDLDGVAERFRSRPHGQPIGGLHAAHQTGIRLKPEPYNGTEDWEEYLSHFQLCSELGRWTEHDRMLALAASLRGPARTFYISLSEEEKVSYRSLVEQLGKRFGSTRQQNRWLSRLESRRRKTDETIASLGDDLRQMAQRAYPNLDTQTQELLALNQLYKSISLEMKCRCIDRNCNSIEQAVDIIERYEAILGDGQDKKKAVRMMTNVTNENRTTTDDGIQKTLRDIVETLEGLKRQQQPRPDFHRGSGSQQRRQPLRCFNCGSTEHLIRNCPKPRRNYDQQNNNGMRGVQRQQNQGNSLPSSH